MICSEEARMYTSYHGSKYIVELRGLDRSEDQIEFKWSQLLERDRVARVGGVFPKNFCPPPPHFFPLVYLILEFSTNYTSLDLQRNELKQPEAAQNKLYQPESATKQITSA
jgi:hypothetical protein